MYVRLKILINHLKFLFEKHIVIYCISFEQLFATIKEYTKLTLKYANGN